MAQSETTYWDLHKWDQGDEPVVYNAAKHNENWDAIDLALREMPLNIKYFRDRGLCPANLIHGDYDSLPAFDFSKINMDDVAIDADNARSYRPTHANKFINEGWALGATYTKALIILDTLIAGNQSTQWGLWIGETVPPAISSEESIPPNAHFGIYSVGNGWFGLYETDNAGSGLGGGPAKADSDPTTNPSVFTSTENGGARGMALYVDGTTVTLFVRHASGTWFPLLTRSDATLTDFTHCGFIMEGDGAGNAVFVGPVVVFAE